MSARVLIAGGGIGGLSAALSCAAQDLDVEVFEQALELGEIGAGIQLSPNCTRVLFDLGLEGALRQIAFVPEAGDMRDWRSGEILTSTALGAAVLAEFGFPYLHVHRADLVAVLDRAVAASTRVKLHTDTVVKSFEQTASSVSLNVRKSGVQSKFTGDVLVGADGIRSTVREQLFGTQAPRFTGNIAWRTLVPAAKLPPQMVTPTATAWWGPGKHFVHYYVRGGELVNCVCVVEKSGWEVESWTERGEYAELKGDFAGWHDTIQTLIDLADKDSLFKWALFDRAPMSQWGQGRVTLLGDACHPTLPFMAQGAAMAIEDGAVLARCATLSGGMSDRLQHYESLRKKRTAGIQNGSRRNAKIFHLSGMQAWARNQALKRVRVNPSQKLFEYDALTAHLS
jgi:salicylate hydroxylase